MSEDRPIDWKEFLREFRESYASEDSAHGNIESKYQLEHESYLRWFEEIDSSIIPPSREDAERYHNVFDALAHFWRIGAPIPPELIDTILYLYKDVYLGREHDISLERAFFNQYGDSEYKSNRRSQDQNAFDTVWVNIRTQFEGLTRTAAAEELAENRGIDPASILERIRRNNHPED